MTAPLWCHVFSRPY